MIDLETLDQKVVALTHDLAELKELVGNMQRDFGDAFGCMDLVNKEIGKIKNKLPKEDKKK